MTFFITAHYANGGISNPLSTITVQTGVNHDGDALADSLDEDDDDDGKLDGEGDLCRLSPVGFMSGPTNDTDGDGCRDRDEDDALIGVTGVSAIPSQEQVMLSWTNPDVPLSHISMSWSEYPSERIIDGVIASDDGGVLPTSRSDYRPAG